MHRRVNWFRHLIQKRAWMRRAPRLLRKGKVPIVLAWAAMVFGVTQTDRFASYIPLQRLEEWWMDWRFQTRGQEPPQKDIVIVGINASSMDQTGLRGLAEENPAVELMARQRFPWQRAVWAALIERLFQAGAKVVALDLVLDGDFPGNDVLAPVIEKYRDRLVLGSMFDDKTEDGNDAKLSYRVPATALIGEGDPALLVGSCLLRSDIDQAIRRFSYRTSMMREFGIDDDSDDIVSFAPLAVAKFLGIESPHGYSQPINFQGRATTYAHYPMEEILVDRLFMNGAKYQDGQLFKDKLVFAGPIAEILHDVHRTPFGEMPGVEIHAQIAGALLSGMELRDAPPNTSRWMALAVSVLAALSVLRIRAAVGQFAALVVLMAAVTYGTQWFFSARHVLTPLGASDFCLVAIGLFGVLLTFTIEQLEKGIIRGVLDRYVSKNVAKLVVERADGFADMLRGEKRRVSVLFSDIRGFTTISEASDATALVDQLNEYFRAMVGCIHRQGGTLQKFIGDAIVAAWGDVETAGYEVDAERAVRTALEMRPALEKLNAGWVGVAQRVPLRIGIGLNHGEVVVGEIGSPERKEFTVLGDAVNTAARFESATKQYGVDLLIGGTVEQLTLGKFVFRRVDFARMKGKKNAVETFTVLSDASVPAPTWLRRYHDAIEHLRAQRWEQATVIFREVNAELGGSDGLCQMYLERIAEYATNPPPTDWDGAHTLTEK